MSMMKQPLWTQTLAWIAAILVALLFAFAGPESADRYQPDAIPQGSTAPR